MGLTLNGGWGGSPGCLNQIPGPLPRLTSYPRNPHRLRAGVVAQPSSPLRIRLEQDGPIESVNRMHPLTASPISLTLHFDGSCDKPGGTPKYGWHIDTPDGVRVADGIGKWAATDPAIRTNNTAEWAGLRAGLVWLSKLRLPVDVLLIHGDSNVVINVLNGEWNSRKEHLTAFRDECLKLLKTIDAGHIEATWIPREENAEADRLSKSRA